MREYRAQVLGQGDEVATKGRGKVYAPAFPASEMDEPEAEVGAGEVRSTEAGEGTTPAPGTSGKGSKPRAIDALMGEMMAKQRERELARLEGREVDPLPAVAEAREATTRRTPPTSSSATCRVTSKNTR